MKKCELCGVENPDEARFCMKCGRDLDADEKTGSPIEVEDFDSWLPAAAEEASLRQAEQKEKTSGDKESYRQAEHLEASATVIEAGEDYHDETPEIQLTDVTADFTERRRMCGRCGTSNPHEQRFCRSCGAPLTDEDRGQEGYESAGESGVAPVADAVYDTYTLADISPGSSDYYAERPLPRTKDKPRRASSTGLVSSLAAWGAREWLTLIIVTLVLVFLVWFFFFGGMGLFFDSEKDNLARASETMMGLKSFRYAISGELNNPETGSCGCDGQAAYESPDRSAWSINLDTAGQQAVQLQQVQIGDSLYSNSGGGWSGVEPDGSNADVALLFEGAWEVEDLGKVKLNGVECLHYKYRTPPALITTVLGSQGSEGTSDVVNEIWIDASTYDVPRLRSTIYNLQINGFRTRATLNFNLAEVDADYGIEKPI